MRGFTQVVEYGTSAEALFQQVRRRRHPRERGLTSYFEGPVTGVEAERDGHRTWITFVIRADGRAQLNIHAEITTEDGKKIALAADGVAIPEGRIKPVFQLRENVTLTTNHPEYAWVNPIQVWAPGTVDVSKREIRIKAYAV